jgi:hypothetical protein
MSPEQERFPVAPSTVQPVAPDPPAIFTVVAVEEPGAILIVEAAPKRLAVVELVLKTFSIPVAEVDRV